VAAAKTRSQARDVDDYLSRLPKASRNALENLRRTIKSIVPEAVEVISYQIPTFKYKGRMLVSYAAFSEHCSFFPGAHPIEVHQDKLSSYETSKGTVRFLVSKPLLAALVKKLVKTRIEENDRAESARSRKKA